MVSGGLKRSSSFFLLILLTAKHLFASNGSLLSISQTQDKAKCRNMFYYVVQFLVFTYKTLQSAFLACVPDFVLEKFCVNLYKQAGVTINGTKPWDITVHNSKYYRRLANEYTLGNGESYMDGWWDCEDMAEMMYRISMKNGPYIPLNVKLINKLSFSVNRQTRAFSRDVIQKHYDFVDKLLHRMLDSNMNYTCGYWKNASDLEQAQLDKMHLIARKLKLKPGMKVLELGCGWGCMAKFLAEKYGVSVVGYTISKEQAKFARELCKDLPVEIRLQDYRDAEGKFDRCLSVGLFEHVGEKNYRTYFEVTNRCLKYDGLSLIQSITLLHKNLMKNEEWINTYIFQHGQLPYETDYSKYSDGLFIIEDLHVFGYDYYLTLMAWYKNFEKIWPEIRNEYGEKFYRMWRYYLLASAGFFKSRKLNLCQVVFSKNGLPGGYYSER